MDIQKQSQRFFSGQMSSAEAEAFMRWLESGASEEELSIYLDALWEKGTDDQLAFDNNELFQKIQQKKDNEISLRKMVVIPEDSTRTFQASWIKWAVAAFIPLLLGVSVLLNPELLSIDGENLPGQSRLITKANPEGQKSKVHLPDGSVVYLNADSRISYLSQFSNIREVTLEGEAYFEVVKDTERPFVVRSGRLSTTALGTSFNIQSFKDLGEVKVTLITGKVSVDDEISKERIILSPNEQVIVNEHVSHLHKRSVSGQLVTYWKDGIIYFDKVPLKEVIAQLERWYGVEFEVNGDIHNLKCSGTFNNEYLANVLQVLGHTLDFDYSINDKKVKINFKPKP
ncbi:FecR family protein [Marinoscillum sp. MHG1-6]|uniref:FecR family protein n=1 Tax=Marinoscillum sp. MHG1-6 TaxID=2959627 RepID=UPI00215815AD|nr:FecR domain-containing protein [Marinoscillum sp. MHG1-6]